MSLEGWSECVGFEGYVSDCFMYAGGRVDRIIDFLEV